MKSKASLRPKQVKIPFLWLACSWLVMLLFGIFLFLFILKKSAVPLFPVAGQSTDPYFFAFLAAVLAPLILQLIILSILRGIAMKHTATQIAKEVGIAVAEVAAITVVDALVSGGGPTSGKTSSGSGKSGGGGEFGGGGASGGY